MFVKMELKDYFWHKENNLINKKDLQKVTGNVLWKLYMNFKFSVPKWIYLLIWFFKCPLASEVWEDWAAFLYVSFLVHHIFFQMVLWLWSVSKAIVHSTKDGKYSSPNTKDPLRNDRNGPRECWYLHIP